MMRARVKLGDIANSAPDIGPGYGPSAIQQRWFPPNPFPDRRHAVRLLRAQLHRLEMDFRSFEMQDSRMRATP